MLARRLGRLGLFLTLLLLAIAPLHAQRKGGITPQAIGPGVAVTPDATTEPTRAPNSGNYSVVFTVFNSGNTALNLDISCVGRVNVVCVSKSTAFLSLASGARSTVNVTYRVTTIGNGRLVLFATQDGGPSDSGYVKVPVAAVAETKPGMAFREFNGDNINRSLCLTAGAGEGAAFQCGDLSIVHSLPGYTAMNKERTLSLLYNSAQAYPFPRVPLTVTQPANFLQPLSVYAELRVSGTLRDSTTFGPWGGTSTAQARQIVLKYDVSAGNPMDSTGVYPFTVTMRNVYSQSVKDSTFAGRLIVVNRSQSEFGAGWGLAGLERLYLNQPVGAPDGTILWVSGDGSAKVYTPHPTLANTWLGAKGGFQDTLKLSAGEYTRTLRYGAQVTFNGQGRHIRTTSRTGQVTTFGYNAGGFLTSITIPPAGQSLTYSLTYDGAQKLDSIADPAGRGLNATVSGGVLTALRDPDGYSTTFLYGTTISPWLITARTNRRGLRTSFVFGQSRLLQVSVPVDSPTTKWSVTAFQAWDAQGVTGGIHTSMGIAVDTAQVYTKVLGPRPTVADDATFWIDRWGAPVKIVDPVGATTKLVRGDPVVPQMVTQVTYPNPAGGSTPGRIVRMMYDSLANLTQVRDSTSHLGAAGLPTKVTRYLYQDVNARFSPNKVIDSIGGQARVTTYTYTAQGLTNDALDPRGHRTVFGYATDGLLNRVTEQQVETWHEGVANDTLAAKQDLVWTFGFDAKRNLKADTSSTGVVTSYVRDTFGRITEVHDALGTKTLRAYDAINRDTLVRRYTTKQPNPYGINPLLASRCDATQVLCSDPTDTLTVLPATLGSRKRYGAVTLDTILDPRNVRRDYAYDARGLVTRERDDFGVPLQSNYDEAGLLLSSVLRSGATTTYAYDLAGRRTLMRFPQVVYNNGAIIPGDSIRYSYDTLGNLLTSTGVNSAGATRTYYANGLLKSKLATSGFPDFISYTYDQTWAPLRVIHNSDTTDYAYSPTTGDLQTVTVRIGTTGTALARTRAFTYAWDGMGRLRQITYPGTPSSGAMTVTYRYDAAGLLRRMKSINPTTAKDIFDIVLRNKSVDAVGRILKQDLVCPVGNVTGNPCGTVNNRSDSVGTSNVYDRTGALVVQNRNGWLDSMRYDASGNMSYKRDGQLGLNHTYLVDPLHNRLVQDQIPGMNNLFLLYDASGSRVTEMGNIVDLREKHYYYDALGRISGTMAYLGLDVRDRPNDCKYDADGQMAAGCDSAPWLGFDGDNVSAVLYAEGEGWTFFHGAGLDSPLMGYYRNTSAGGPPRLFYWVTDGAGREFAVADSAGVRQSSDQGPDIGTWRQAGGIANSYSFSSDRQDNANISHLSFFRNRVYDQNTGRWLQEDPIGVAGGLNLYAFNGNNPVAYTDPFGLCPPRNSSPCTLGDVASLNVSAGLQLGASLSVGLVGAYTKVQLGRVANIEVSAKYPAELTVSDAEASVEVGGELVGQRGGLKLDLAQDAPQLVGTGSLGSNDVGHESAQRDGRNRTTKIGVQVGIGADLNINWSAIADLGRQAYEKLKNTLAGGGQ